VFKHSEKIESIEDTFEKIIGFKDIFETLERQISIRKKLIKFLESFKAINGKEKIVEAAKKMYEEKKFNSPEAPSIGTYFSFYTAIEKLVELSKNPLNAVKINTLINQAKNQLEEEIAALTESSCKKSL
jgi:hypothetical protein